MKLIPVDKLLDGLIVVFDLFDGVVFTHLFPADDHFHHRKFMPTIPKC